MDPGVLHALIALAVVAFIVLSIILVRWILIYYTKLYHKGGNSIFFQSFIEYSKAKSQRIAPLEQQLSRGDILVRDFRDNENNAHDNNKSYLRIISLNIEMGKQIDDIISTLQDLNADIICLQEVDVATKRAHFVDMVGEIANALKLNSLFTVETWPNIINPKHYNKNDNNDHELSQLTAKNKTGYEGNAILTKYDFKFTKGLILDCARKNKHKYKIHNEAVAIIDSPFGDIGCYSLHLDAHDTTIKNRVNQYYQVLEDAKQQRIQYNVKHQIICGDLNTKTMFLKCGCCGMNEAEYFEINGVDKGNDIYNLDFEDPFDKKQDITMHALKGLFQIKLDWCLISKSLTVKNKCVCPIENKCSDHQWVLVDCV